MEGLKTILCKVVDSNTFGSDCAVCGSGWDHHDHVPAYFVYLAFADDPNPQNVIGVICPTCIMAGPTEGTKRMIAYARRLIQQADSIMGLVEQMDTITQWLTFDDLERFEAEHKAAEDGIPF